MISLIAAGYVLHKTLELLGLLADHIYVHVLSKGTNVHSETEVSAMERMVDENGIERVVVLDQGSRPGKIVGNLPDGGKALLLIDHHQSEEVSHIIKSVWSEGIMTDRSLSTVSTRCCGPHSVPYLADRHNIPFDIYDMSTSSLRCTRSL